MDRHLFAVSAGAGGHDFTDLRLRCGDLLTSEDERCGKSQHIPFERTMIRFVKIIDVEHDAAIGGSEQSEIGQVRITAQHRGDARRRQRP